VRSQVHISICVLAIAAAALGPWPAGAVEQVKGQVQIEQRAEFAARAQKVLLGDIATLRTTDLPTIQRLSALSLGQSPAVGAEAVLRRDVIVRWVRSQLGIDTGQVLWSGAEETRVHTFAQEFPASRIEQVAKDALRDWLDKHATRYGIDAMALPAEIRLPVGQVQLKARPLAPNAEPTARMLVWVDVQVDGRFVRAVPVSFAVDAYRNAWVAPAAIAGRVVLGRGMVEKREVQITAQSGAGLRMGISQPGEIPDGWRTSKPIGKGEPVTTANSGPAPAIARGDWIALHLSSGSVELERRVQALQDGALGQIVKVRSSNDATPIDARVVAPGQVEAML
jgi:flagellar basal body P-ring formation protein FlgA